MPVTQVKPVVGLVLSGGGAKGAYQVGVLKALAELDIGVHAVSGASIGALNGLVVATSPTLAKAAATLEEEWSALIGASPIEFRVDLHNLLVKAAEYMTIPSGAAPGSAFKWTGTAATLTGRSVLLGGLFMGLRKAGIMEGSWADPQEIEATVGRHLTDTALDNGLPFYVSLFESGRGLQDRLHLLQKLLGTGTKPSEVMHVQSLSAADRRAAVLASAAIPLILPARTIQGRRFVDGGMGGDHVTQGNTPAEPLVTQAGCTHLIVTHLFDGSTWRRDGFDATVLEIRPRRSTQRHEGVFGMAGDFLDMLNFTDAIPAWIEQGYEDTMRCVGDVKQALDLVATRANAEARRDAAIDKLATDGFEIA